MIKPGFDGRLLLGRSLLAAASKDSLAVNLGLADVQVLAEALACQDLGLLRAKGFARSVDGQIYAIQVVGRRWSVALGSTWMSRHSSSMRFT